MRALEKPLEWKVLGTGAPLIAPALLFNWKNADSHYLHLNFQNPIGVARMAMRGLLATQTLFR